MDSICRLEDTVETVTRDSHEQPEGSNAELRGNSPARTQEAPEGVPRKRHRGVRVESREGTPQTVEERFQLESNPA